MILDRMAWFEKDSIKDLRWLKSELTVHEDYNPYKRKIRQVKLWEETENFIGVPRMWGIKYREHICEESYLINKTVFPCINWPIVKFPGDGSYWKGQKEAVNAIYDVFRKEDKFGALLEAHCGSGKTLLSTSIASRMSVKTLVLVHKEDLAEQWWNTINTFFKGAKLGHVQGDRLDYKDKNLVTATVQTLYSRKDILPDDFWKSFGLIIYDESHKFPAFTFEQVMKLFYAKYRLGVSATWRRSDGLGCIWNYHIGEIEHKMMTTRLTGFYKLCPWNTALEDRMFRSGKNMMNSKYISAIGENKAYNTWLAEQIAKSAGVGRRVLCVSDRLSQLGQLRSKILSMGLGLSVGMYVGKLDGKKVYPEDLLYAKTCDIVLATYGKIQEGTDAPELDTLFIGTPRADVEQIVGRIQRHGKDKRQLLVVDPVFQTDYMIRLGKKREKMYKKLGFKEQI